MGVFRMSTYGSFFEVIDDPHTHIGTRDQTSMTCVHVVCNHEGQMDSRHSPFRAVLGQGVTFSAGEDLLTGRLMQAYRFRR